MSDAATAGSLESEADEPAWRPRLDFRPSVPDVSTFPRAAWLRALREAVATIADADLGYGDPRGVDALRSAPSRIARRTPSSIWAPSVPGRSRPTSSSSSTG